MILYNFTYFGQWKSYIKFMSVRFFLHFVEYCLGNTKSQVFAKCWSNLWWHFTRGKFPFLFLFLFLLLLLLLFGKFPFFSNCPPPLEFHCTRHGKIQEPSKFWRLCITTTIMRYKALEFVTYYFVIFNDVAGPQLDRTDEYFLFSLSKSISWIYISNFDNLFHFQNSRFWVQYLFNSFAWKHTRWPSLIVCSILF